MSEPEVKEMPMFEISVPIADLRVGDVICGLITDYKPETITRAIDEASLTFETDVHTGWDCWHCSDMGAPMPVRFSTAKAFAEAILKKLGEYPAEIRRAVAAQLCAVCGERRCGKHR
jgi:hypothetical protein